MASLKKPKIAVVGATGNVGREVLDIIDEREIQYSDLVALASSRSKGSTIEFGENKSIIASIRMYSEEFRFSTPIPISPATTVVSTSHNNVNSIHTPNPTAIEEPMSLAQDDANNWSEVYHRRSKPVAIVWTNNSLKLGRSSSLYQIIIKLARFSKNTGIKIAAQCPINNALAYLDRSIG